MMRIYEQYEVVNFKPAEVAVFIRNGWQLSPGMTGKLCPFFPCIVINIILSKSPELTERVYSRGVYIAIRKFYDLVESLFVVPGILIAVVLIIVLPIMLHNKRKTRTVGSRYYLVINLVSYVGAIFYLSWGYNYNRIPFLEQSKIVMIKPDSTMLIEEYIETINKVNSLTSLEFDERLPFDTALEILQDEMKNTLSFYGYPTNFNVRIRKWSLKGLLLRIGTSGVYIPHSLEGNIDGGLHIHQIPIVASHELTHGFGITHEGVANFLAYKACSNSRNSHIKYTAELNYLRYIASEVRRRYPEIWKEQSQKINSKVNSDLSDIRSQMKKYPDLMPKTRDKIYDRYLKSHGLKDGIQSYNLLVRLVLSENYEVEKEPQLIH